MRKPRKSQKFYESLLGYKPTLDVPGMTEFALAPNVSLGIMPETGIMRLLKIKYPIPPKRTGFPDARYIYMSTTRMNFWKSW